MNAMHSTKVIQCPLVQTLFRRLSTSDCLAVNSTNSHYGLSKSWDDDKHNLNTVSYNSQRFFLTTDPQPTTFRRRLSSASEHKATINSEMASTSTDSPDSTQRTNRLANEKSPYLRQHMHNPVNWYPWGEEAFERAREENKLIFLSVGYSTCHWCHVMEKESFENDSVAEIMNKHFINIKVDREERPDIDKIYMAFVQATTHHGGWPMSVFLTPDLKPVTGGTYFPPENSRYQVGFKTILNKVSKAWEENRDDLIRIGETFINTLQKACDNNLKKKANVEVPSLNVMNKGCQQYIQNFESEFGGWNEMPKFPQPSNFNFLFHVYARDKESEMGKICYDMSVYTLKKMANGGIYDHIGDGFSRYSVDNKWHVPHFEKMLYDQGQLAVSYCDAYLVTKEESFADVVRGILRYVSRDLSHKEGGFFSAEDADSLPNSVSAHKTEGAFYVWDYDEIKRILGNKKLKDVSYMDIFAHHFNVLPQGNVDKSQDPHGELENKNVLIIFGSVANTASNFNMTNEEVESVINESKQLLYTAREKRPRPHLDSKIITAWNGLMMSGYAKAGQILKDDAYINRAIQCAKFIRKHMYDERTKMLLRSCYRASNNEIDQVSNPIPGFLDDYAFLVRGLLDLYEATFDTDWLQWAETIQEQQDQLFWDTKSNGYFNSSAGDKNTIMRLKEDQDGAEPSGNSVAAQNLLRIAAYLNRTDMKAKAGEILSVFSDRLEKIPLALPEMMSSLISFHDAPTKVFIAGPADDPQTNALLDVVRARLMPCRTLAVMDGPRGRSALLYNRLEVVSRLKPLAGRPAAYVCRHYQCSLPVTEPTELAEILDQSENTP